MAKAVHVSGVERALSWIIRRVSRVSNAINAHSSPHIDESTESADTFADGTVYRGGFKNGMFHGQVRN